MEYTIDAKEKKIGRVASAAAKILMGKNTPSYKPNVAPQVEVNIVNAGQISIPLSKLKTKTYTHYSGYPGGLKEDTLERLMDKKGIDEVLRKAVKGMLPANRLRSEMLKNLKITE